jgi:hypothetical protein
MEALLIPAFLIVGLWLSWRVMIAINYYTFGERQERERRLAERNEARRKMRNEGSDDDDDTE